MLGDIKFKLEKVFSGQDENALPILLLDWVKARRHGWYLSQTEMNYQKLLKNIFTLRNEFNFTLCWNLCGNKEMLFSPCLGSWCGIKKSKREEVKVYFTSVYISIFDLMVIYLNHN